MQTPRYEYSKAMLQERITYLLGLSLPYGYTLRYAVKANPFAPIIELMNEQGVHFDASSSYEAQYLLSLGILGSHISLSSQQSPHNLQELLALKVQFVATSIQQLETFLETEGRENTVAVRINPEVGYGHNNRTSTGGRNSSFGIWHEYAKAILEKVTQHNVTISRVHIHVGSGADPSVWGSVMDAALSTMELFPDATVLDIGGGFKVHRYGDENEADMEAIAAIFTKKLTTFYERTLRKLHLEIEPGTYFVAHAGTLVATVDDIVDTGKEGHTFLRLNTGMNDFLRSTLYGARHKIEVVATSPNTKAYVVVGHNCESGDILTPEAGNPEAIEPRVLTEAKIGDEVRISDVGAYCGSMRAKGYNAFPDALEIMVA